MNGGAGLMIEYREGGGFVGVGADEVKTYFLFHLQTSQMELITKEQCKKLMLTENNIS